MATKLKSTLLKDIQAANTGAAMVYASLFQIRLDPNQPRKLKLGFIADSADGVPVPPKVRLQDVATILAENKSEDQTALVRLALNILREGVRTPITVTSAPDGLFQVVTGERRVTAALLARNWAVALKAAKDDLGYTLREGYDYDTIPAVVESVENAERFRIQVAENLLRQDMSPADLGQAWKKMLSDGLFPNVYAIARHFGIEESRIQSHIDMLDMTDEVAALRAMGVTSVEIIGRLLSAMRKARKAGDTPALYDNFVALWATHTTTDDDGNPVYPSARMILDLARKERQAPATQAPAAPVKTTLRSMPEPAAELDTGSDGAEFEREFAADADEHSAEGYVLPAEQSRTEFEAAELGQNLSKAPSTAKLDRAHRTDTLNIPAFDLPRAQARRVLAALGLNIDEDEITAENWSESVRSFQ